MTDFVNKARQGTKRYFAIEVMIANADKPMAEVLPLIQEAAGLPNVGAARGYYKGLVEQGLAPGQVEKTVRASKPKAAKKVTVGNTSTARAAEGAAPPELTADEVEAARQANLAKIKEVHQRMVASGKLPGAAPVAVETQEFDEEDENEDHRAALSADDLAELGVDTYA